MHDILHHCPVVYGLWSSRETISFKASVPVRELDSKACSVRLLRDPLPLSLEKDPALLDAEYLMSFFLCFYNIEAVMRTGESSLNTKPR